MSLLAMIFRVAWIPYHREHRWLLVFMCASVLSCFVSPMPEYSLARLLTFILMFITVFIGLWVWLQRPVNVHSFVFVLVATATIGALWCGIYILQLSSLVPETRFTGAFGKATGTGSFCAASLPIILWKARYAGGKQKMLFGLVLAILFYTLIFSGSRSAIIGGLFATMVWLWKHWPKFRPGLLFFPAIVAALFAAEILSLEMLPGYVVRTESLSTFTGRIPRWKAGLSLFEQSPAIGHGYGMTRYIRLFEDGDRLRGTIAPGQVTFLDLIPGVGKARLGRTTLHSDHVERLVEGGIVGYIPFASFWFVIISRFTQVLWRPVNVNNSLALALGLNVCYIFLDSFMHGALFAINSPGTILSWVAIVVFMAASERTLQGPVNTGHAAHPPRHP
ncbi:O-antigen ligase family protein [Thermopirellula anaerolimosa]